ncbi:MAG: ROK family transcriptional regulator [Spirochaetes bacterium]|nr:ROK family transcriptional regulator [Spirochaetota bacterium]
MTPRGQSAPDLRRGNRAALLRLVFRHGAIARNDLARILGLTRAGVTILVTNLIDEGLVEEAGLSGASGHAGRRKVFLRIRPQAGKLLGFGVDNEKVQAVLTDLTGSVLAFRNLPSPAVPSLAGQEAIGPLMGFVREATAGLLGGKTCAEAGVLAAGLGVTGRVDASIGVSLREPRLWEGPVALKVPIESALGITVSVDNNVRALALAESLLTESRSHASVGLLFVKYGPGVGGAWTVGGVPWQGIHHGAGELGHTLVELEGPVCPYCGRRGCLESLVSARTLGEKLSMPGLRIDQLIAELEKSDAKAFSLIATRFARALSNAIELYDPGTVALYGLAFKNEALLSAIQERVESNERPCIVRRSYLDPELPAIGGIALALDEILERGGLAVATESRSV